MKLEGVMKLVPVALLAMGAVGCGDVVCEYTLPAGETTIEGCDVRRKSDCNGIAHPMEDGDDRQSSSPMPPGRRTCNQLGYTTPGAAWWRKPFHR